jgi:hypothetical protein
LTANYVSWELEIQFLIPFSILADAMYAVTAQIWCTEGVRLLHPSYQLPKESGTTDAPSISFWNYVCGVRSLGALEYEVIRHQVSALSDSAEIVSYGTCQC